MNIFKKLKAKWQEKKEKELRQEAQDVYQIREHDGDTWLTYHNHLVLPMAFLRNDSITTLLLLRDAYIERNKV